MSRQFLLLIVIPGAKAFCEAKWQLYEIRLRSNTTYSPYDNTDIVTDPINTKNLIVEIICKKNNNSKK